MSILDLIVIVEDEICIKQATKAGYIPLSSVGVLKYKKRCCDLSYPTSKTRRGRVQGGGKFLQQLQRRLIISVIAIFGGAIMHIFGFEYQSVGSFRKSIT